MRYLVRSGGLSVQRLQELAAGMDFAVVIPASVAATGSSLGFVTRMPVVTRSCCADSSAWRRVSSAMVLS